MFETTNQYIYNYEWNSTYVHSHKIVSIAIWCDMYLHLFSICKLGLAMEDCHVHCISFCRQTNWSPVSFFINPSLSVVQYHFSNNSGWIISINEPENDWNNAVLGMISPTRLTNHHSNDITLRSLYYPDPFGHGFKLCLNTKILWSLRTITLIHFLFLVAK